jgi:dolichol-phosphate mannosyltransferase
MQPRLSIVMPIYNEAATLEQITKRVHAACGDFAEVIFVDDGSTDDSLAIAKHLARPQDTVLHKENGGKGSAVRMGYAHANGHYVIVQDADLEYSPEEIPEMLSFAEKNDHAVVFGSRRLKKQKQYVHFSIFLGGSFMTYYFNALYYFPYRVVLTDQPTCYKMVRGDVLKTIPLKENDFRFDPELTSMLVKRGYKIPEYPISYHPRSVAEGKKINWKDGFKWVWVFTKVRFQTVNGPMPH